MSSQLKVLFLDTVHPALQEELVKMNFQCDDFENFKDIPLEKLISQYHGLVLRAKFSLDKALLEKAVQLKFIARAGAGMENIDLKYAESRGIACLKAPEGNKDAVADHAVGMLLTLFKKLHIADFEVRRGFWNRESNRGIELTGKTVGIIGYGYTGSEFARRLKGFNCKVLAYDKYKKGFSNGCAEESDMANIYENTDILSLHIPYTKETDYLVNYSFISRFKKSIYLVNTSRGKIVKTDDLVKHLKTGKISGACLDVVEYESASFERLKGLSMWTNKRGIDINRLSAYLVRIGLWRYLHPVQYLVKCNRVLLTPHVAGWSAESYEKISLILAERIRELGLHEQG